MAVPTGGMFDHVTQPGPKASWVGGVRFTGKALTTTSGTLSTATGAKFCPFLTITKTGSEVGRYTVQVVNSRGIACGGFKSFEDFTAYIVGAADAAYTTAKGLAHEFRNVDPQAGSFDIQFMKGDGNTDIYADAELEDAASFGFGFTARKSSALS